jgi:hypothetical protein
MLLLDICHFYARHWTSRHVFLMKMSVSCLILLVGAAAFYLMQASVESESNYATHQVTLHPADAHTPRTRSFHFATFDSVPLLDAIIRGADIAGLKVDEVKFALDDSPAQTFLRYRATFLLTGRYLGMRNFVKQVNSTMQNSSLDGVHCRREDIDVADVECELTLSAWYRRSTRG